MFNVVADVACRILQIELVNNPISDEALELIGFNDEDYHFHIK